MVEAKILAEQRRNPSGAGEIQQIMENYRPDL